jgi:hypothetical protein
MIEGGCLCRAVRYEIEAQPITARVCWCRTCQAFGARGPTVNVCFLSQAIRIRGPLRDYCSVADSGNVMHRRDAEAQTIVENCGNTLILRCSASERGGTAEFASRLIGQREIIRKQIAENQTSLFDLLTRASVGSDDYAPIRS